MTLAGKPQNGIRGASVLLLVALAWSEKEVWHKAAGVMVMIMLLVFVALFTEPVSSSCKASVVEAEYDALSADKKAQFLGLTSSDDLDPFGLDANVIKDIFGVGSATVTALAAARIEIVSRSVELGLGKVGEGDVWDVRNGN